MNDSKIKVITREEIEREKSQEKRAEITFLEILVKRYPEPAKRLVDKHVCKKGETCVDVV